jgi:ribosomal protein S18 acetylase RimI-like enzyme
MRREALGSSVCLRAAVPADSHFAYLVLEQTMRGYAEATWGEWHDDRAREEMRVAASDGRSEIIEVDGERAGFLRAVLHEGSHLELDKLFVLPAHQRQGIGTKVLVAVLARAQAAGLPVRLRVLCVNPAKALYERHGFGVTAQDPIRFFMERPL